MNPSLGTLARLPVEIRAQIYENAFGLDSLGYLMARAQDPRYATRIHVPPLLAISKEIREEAQGVFNHLRRYEYDLTWNYDLQLFLPIEFLQRQQRDHDLVNAQNLEIHVKLISTSREDHRQYAFSTQAKEPTVDELDCLIEHNFLNTERRHYLRLLLDWNDASLTEKINIFLYMPFARTLSKLKNFETVDVDIIWSRPKSGFTQGGYQDVLARFQTFWSLRLGPSVLTKGWYEDPTEEQRRLSGWEGLRPMWTLRFKPWRWHHEKAVKAKEAAWAKENEIDSRE